MNNIHSNNSCIDIEIALPTKCDFFCAFSPTIPKSQLNTKATMKKNK